MDNSPMKELKMEILCLDGITTFSDLSIFSDKVKKIILRYTSLSQIPFGLERLTNLVELHLNGNCLVSLPDNIGVLGNLELLDISGNDLTCLPDSIKDLKELRILLANRNKLEQLPDSIGNLINLHNLLLSDNRLSKLPDSIKNLSNLKLLYLDSNQLTSLPPGIHFQELLILNLKGNPIRFVHLDIGGEEIAKLYPGYEPFPQWNPFLHVII